MSNSRAAGGEPKHHLHFPFVSAEILYLVELGKISAREFLLLAFVKSYTKNAQEACWASNGHLAKVCGIQEREVRRLLAKMEEQGYVRRVSSPERPDRRHLFVDEEAVKTESTSLGYVPQECTNGGRLFTTGGAVLHNRHINTPNKNQTQTPPPPAAVPGGDGGQNKMGFLPTPPAIIQHHSTDKQVDHQLTVKLRTAIQKVSGASALTSYSETAWTRQMAKLRQLVGEQQLRCVLDWYEKHGKGEYKPKVYSPSSLKTKFGQLLDAMKRHETNNPTVEVTEAARCVAQDIKNAGYCPIPLEEFAKLVQVGMDNTKKFQNWFRSVDWKAHGLHFWVEADRPHFPNPSRGFHERWWEPVMRWAADKTVSVDVLRRWVWRWEADKNQEYMTMLAREWGSQKDWLKFQEVYNAAHS